jgi:hypothetical protein
VEFVSLDMYVVVVEQEPSGTQKIILKVITAGLKIKNLCL